VGDLSEDAFVDRIARKLPLDATVRVGPGDDCAVVGKPRDVLWQLLKTDAVLEGVHFAPGEDFRRVGWKALCRNISDIAAMGGIPRHALVTIAVPPETALRKVEDLYAGLSRAARRYGVAIVGGETSRSPGGIFVSVALTGEVERKRCVLRSGGRPGDVVFVTGRLGGSLRSGRHLDFEPRVEQARWLTEHFLPHAMMDLSDGLGSDLPRLTEASGCGFMLDQAAIPCAKGCTVQQAITDGEDFELLFTISARKGAALAMSWARRFPRLPLTQIGTLTAKSRRSIRGQIIPHGFDHFAQSI
jgi:thiamine-monophosphate kinase